MRTLVDIPDAEIDELDALSKREQRSRASVIREAIGTFLQHRRPKPGSAYGLWGERKLDGLAYQKKARSEW